METKNIGTRWITGVTAAMGLLALTAGAFADPPTTMAPPISSQAQTGDPVAAGAGADSVFQWNEVPENQNVPLTRAVFDQGGYQLYDTAGETIVVPFANNNLYVMKFAVSPDGTTYFVNTGSAPILYIPRGGSLENAAVPGARWYPFSKEFHPAEPVFLGIAPSYTDFVGMGWYPDMVCYGGYYGYHPFIAGGLFLPTLGLAFFIGGHPYYGWGSYHHYYYYHSAPYHVAYVNRGIYHSGGRGFGTFRGTGRSLAGRPYGATGHGFSGGTVHEGRAFSSGHTFKGAQGFNGAGHTAYAHRAFSGSRTFQGTRSSSGGGRSFSGGHVSAHYSGGGHAFGGGHGGGGERGGGGHGGGGEHGGGGGHSGRH
jgi:hypothetical protein